MLIMCSCMTNFVCSELFVAVNFQDVCDSDYWTTSMFKTTLRNTVYVCFLTVLKEGSICMYLMCTRRWLVYCWIISSSKTQRTHTCHVNLMPNPSFARCSTMYSCLKQIQNKTSCWPVGFPGRIHLNLVHFASLNFSLSLFHTWYRCRF